MNRYSSVFVALRRAEQRGCYISKEELCLELSSGKTSSLKELTDGQIVEAVQRLNRISSTQAKRWVPSNGEDLKRDTMRKKIISQFRFIGKTATEAIFWAEKYGVHGTKRKFNDYTVEELSILIEMSKKVKRDFVKQF